MVKDISYQLVRDREKYKTLILRIINARGVSSYDFLVSMLLFGITHQLPDIDITDAEVHGRMYKFCSDLITEMHDEGSLGLSEVDNPFIIFEHTRSCVHLTLLGAWKTWLAIKKSPIDTMTEYCFACQIECQMDDIYFIDHELYYTMNIAHGPFFNFDDPSNPASQEELF